jgi:glutathione peroxidase
MDNLFYSFILIFFHFVQINTITTKYTKTPKFNIIMSSKYYVFAALPIFILVFYNYLYNFMGNLMFKMVKKTGTDTFKNIPEVKFKNIPIKDIDGKDITVGDLTEGKKATLIVNTASSCGLTDNNYRQLVEIYDKYKDSGLQIIGLPCNQFMGQESKCELDIKNLTKNKFKVTFPLTSKVDVNGPETHELFKYLKTNSKLNEGDGKLKNIEWNFGKFLVNENGEVVNYYDPKTDPDQIVPDIEKTLH